MSILLVDSNVDIEIQVKSLFLEYGFSQLDIVRSGEQAKQFLIAKENQQSADTISLVIIDNQLDDGDGFELCHELRAHELTKNAYIILLVSSAENRLAIEKARQSGANDYSVKPYASIEFARHLQMYSLRRVVYLVDDDPLIMKMLQPMLKHRYIELLVAEDGLQAYNQINTMLLPKLVLLDIGLPNLSGLKLVQHIRSKALWKKVPVLMLTANTEASDVKAALSSGANDYIVKPFRVDDLSNRIDQFFN